MKQCTDCKEKKDLSEFSERPNYSKSGKVYLKSQCKACDVKRMKEWREKNGQRYRDYQNKYNRELRKKAVRTATK